MHALSPCSLAPAAAAPVTAFFRHKHHKVECQDAAHWEEDAAEQSADYACDDTYECIDPGEEEFVENAPPPVSVLNNKPSYSDHLLDSPHALHSRVFTGDFPGLEDALHVLASQNLSLLLRALRAQDERLSLCVSAACIWAVSKMISGPRARGDSKPIASASGQLKAFVGESLLPQGRRVAVATHAARHTHPAATHLHLSNIL